MSANVSGFANTLRITLTNIMNSISQNTLLAVPTRKTRQSTCTFSSGGRTEYDSFPVRLFHPRLHAGLSRRST
jgi:hypothetical protein